MRSVASLVVWSQGNKTFTLTDLGAIDSDGAIYHITNADITVAHPTEMKSDDISAWQQYFIKNSLKQPFEQIWEPVYDPAAIKTHRYTGCAIPYYYFTNQEKHGIITNNRDFGNEPFTITDCETTILNVNRNEYDTEAIQCFEISEFSFKSFTRKVNHIVAYFDRITVSDRIAKDDVSVGIYLPRFTLAQITEFIKIANENNSTNAMAVLLNYKNKNFANFDPLEEFVL